MPRKKTNTKESEEETVYDLKEAINNLEANTLLKKGFEYYINHNTVNIKDNNTLQKEFKKFKEGV